MADRGVAIVTGGARGIGLACAERLEREGFAICIWDADGEAIDAAMENLRGDVQAFEIDITDAAACDRALRDTVETMGRPRALVHSAGIAGSNAPVIDYDIAEWRRIVDVDLTGTFLVNRFVAARMKANGYGRIVNIASVAGKEGNPNASAYSAAKAGVIALTKSLGKEMADVDVAVNCVTPAAARTPIFEQMSDAHIAYMLSKIPRARFLEVDEAAAMIAWLCTAENSFATGAVFDLSGGRATY